MAFKYMLLASLPSCRFKVESLAGRGLRLVAETSTGLKFVPKKASNGISFICSFDIIIGAASLH